jgi:hypothetical protein
MANLLVIDALYSVKTYRRYSLLFLFKQILGFWIDVFGVTVSTSISFIYPLGHYTFSFLFFPTLFGVDSCVFYSTFPDPFRPILSSFSHNFSARSSSTFPSWSLIETCDLRDGIRPKRQHEPKRVDSRTRKTVYLLVVLFYVGTVVDWLVVKLVLMTNRIIAIIFLLLLFFIVEPSARRSVVVCLVVSILIYLQFE